ncbi:MAG: 4-hydroxybenzoate octaprenyltransferase, partial [Amylibacter sp.]|nr:4-hydroxybenzoate octaprenyltransferase [Amylibacter sp.]
MSEKRQTPDQTDRVADAVNKNWVDLYAPTRFRPYLRLSRAYRPAGTWLLLIPCIWSLCLASLSIDIGYSTNIKYVILMSIGAFLMRGAGCTWNDITDLKIDVSVKRTKSRPIPSGQITVKQALKWMLIQTLAGAVILFSFDKFTISLGLIALIPVAIYPFAKRFTWWPQLFLGIAFNWGALIGWSSLMGSLSLSPILLYLSGISWTLFYDTIYAHQDKEDDALIGVKSTARLFQLNTKKWLWLFLIISITLMTLAFITALKSENNIFCFIIGITGILAFGIHLIWQLINLDINNADNCLMIFRS